MDTVEQRIERLERGLKRYRNLTVALGLGLVGLVTVAATEHTPERSEAEQIVAGTITCQRLAVVNEEGQRVVWLRSMEASGGRLDIYNRAGTATTRICNGGGGFLQIRSEEGKEGFWVGAMPAGGAMYVFDADGKGRVRVLGDTAVGTGGYVSITNKTGESVARILVDEYGNGVVGAYNRKGKGKTLKPGP